MYKTLFTPCKIGNVEIKNRLVMSPMGIGIANLDGTPSEEMIEFYEQRAQGGCGLIYTEVCRVNDVHGAALLRQLSMTRDRNIEPMARMVSRIHKYGTKMFCQLHHPGRETHRSLIGGQLCVGASDRMCKFEQEETRALSTEEVKDLVQDYISAAKRAQQAGFDGVEIHCAHGYLPGQFMSPYTNNRTDEYGGNFENRMRFPIEILEGIRAVCGHDFPVTFRISADEMLDMYGVNEPHIRWQDGVEIAKCLEQAGIDAINISCGIYETGVPVIEPTTWPQGWRSYFIKAIKDAVNIPVIAVNNIREAQVAEQLLEDGVQDFIAMGRTWIAEPQWGKKVMEGREDEICKCIGCLRCFESLSTNTARNYPPECSMNPKAFKEKTFREEKYDAEHHKVAVIGAGPAGLCAALTCAERGMDVTLFEQSDRIGGLVNYAAAAPKKERMNWLMDYYRVMLAKHQVKLRLNTVATVEMLREFGPDAIIVATGAQPISPNIPGKDNENVFGIFDVLDGRSGLEGKKVIVAGAGITGLECASYLNEKDCRVTVIDILDRIAPTGNARVVEDDVMRLKAENTEFMLGVQLVEIRKNGVLLKSLESGEESFLDCEAVVLSLGIASDNALGQKLKDEFDNVHIVGGAVDAGGMIHGATNSAYRVARNLFVEQPKVSFKLPASDIKKFGERFFMGSQEGVAVAFLTDPDVVEKILPPPLKPYTLPVVTFTLCHVKNPSFSAPYYEAVLGVYCTLNGQLGSYPISLLLCGPGAEMAQLVGRDIASWPKKLADECVLKKDGDRMFASVTRHGTELIRAEFKLGQYNHPLMHTLYQAPESGKDTKGLAYCYKFDHVNAADGSVSFGNARILGNLCEYHYTDWQPAFASIELRSGPDDPWGELPVTTVIGGAYECNDLNLPGNLLLAEVEADEVMPYLMTSRYDRSAFMETDAI